MYNKKEGICRFGESFIFYLYCMVCGIMATYFEIKEVGCNERYNGIQDRR